MHTGRFLGAMLERLNAGRGQRLAEEMEVMRELPERRMESDKRERVKVDSGSLIYAGRNVYSVPSRLIGEQVEARLFMDHVEVWYGQKKGAREFFRRENNWEGQLFPRGERACSLNIPGIVHVYRKNL